MPMTDNLSLFPRSSNLHTIVRYSSLAPPFVVSYDSEDTIDEDSDSGCEAPDTPNKIPISCVSPV